jgi:phosphate butyryltransferase
MPERIDMIRNFDELVKAVQAAEKSTVAVAAAEDMDVINIASACENLADFIFIGDAKKIEALIKESGKNIKGEILDIPDHALAAAKAVELVKTGRAQNLMKGLLHTAVFLKAVLNKESGLNKGRLISQAMVFEKKDKSGFQILTDCAVNIAPTLMQKKEIIENAVEVARALGYERPAVAVLAALEIVNPDMPATMDAAILTVMAQHGQIKNAVVDGPLAMDNAIDPEAARHKGIGGLVAGNADILVVPDIEAGNMVSKALVFWANTKSAAAMPGIGTPMIVNSRTEALENKILTVALSAYLALKRK